MNNVKKSDKKVVLKVKVEPGKRVPIPKRLQNPKKGSGPNGSKKKAVAKMAFAPVAIASNGPRKREMRYESSPDMSTLRVRGCEPIITVMSGSSFQQRMDEYINPLNEKLFPILKPEASLFDKWRPNSLRLIYDPRCPTSTVGQVGLVLLPDDEVSEAPDSMVGVEYYQYGVTTASWTGCKTEMGSKALAENWYFTALNDEFSSPASIGDRRTQAPGVAQIWVQGGVDNTLVGTVYMEYDITFCERRPPLVLGASVKSPNLNLQAVTGALTPTGSNNLNPDVVTNQFGNPVLLFSRSSDLLTALTNPSIAAYTALGLPLLARSCFGRLQSGTSFAQALTLFSGVAPPLSFDDEKHDQEWVQPQIQEKYTTSINNRYPHRPEFVVYDYSYYKSEGPYFYGADSPRGPWTLLSEESKEVRKRITSPLATNDCATYMFFYNNVANTYSIVSASSANSNSTLTLSTSGTITNLNDYPIYAGLSNSANMNAGQTRVLQTTISIFCNDR